jgi:DNA-directed RNA polymerase sigma subunit (sigma70/sigma32)
MKTIPRWTNEDRGRNVSSRIIPTAPIRTLDEVAEILRLTRDQVRHAEALAFAKLRQHLAPYAKEYAR